MSLVGTAFFLILKGMKTLSKVEGTTRSFIMADVDPVQQDAIRDLYYTPVAEGFAKQYTADTPHLDQIYQNFARYAAEMVQQASGLTLVPWQESLLAFLQLVEGQEIEWWLIGSGALAVRGADLMPRDLDLITDAAGAVRLGQLLLDYLVEPVQYSEGWIGNWFGRAFLHARLEWVGAVAAGVDTPYVTDFGPAAAAKRELVSWRGYPIYLPPLDLQLAVTERRGLTARADQLRRLMTTAP
ncbi:MAG: hypothetical protein R6X32_06505 [Chloroflexota bacterium]